MNKITPCLWFDNNAEEAVNFYCSVFKNSKVLNMSRSTDVGPGNPGSVLTAAFEIDGQQLTALNGGPQFTFTEAISLMVMCDTQQEIDDYWAKLTANGGKESQCGWLKGQVRAVLADRAQDRAAVDAGQGPREAKPRDEGTAQNGQT
jgi:predicted 3-demethylubiquinone-9 3-methyltransferase (glyoxalase superfamily)